MKHIYAGLIARSIYHSYVSDLRNIARSLDTRLITQQRHVKWIFETVRTRESGRESSLGSVGDERTTTNVW